MERRKFVIGLGALASGTAAAVGTGAFSAAEAEREIAFTAADDSDALLGLEAGSNNHEYVKTKTYDYGGDHVKLQFNDHHEDVDGQGVNRDSIYWFDNVLRITNNGPNTIKVWTSQSGATRTSLYWGSDRDSSAEGETNAYMPLESGGYVEIGVKHDHWGGNEFGDITIYAEEVDKKEDIEH